MISPSELADAGPKCVPGWILPRVRHRAAKQERALTLRSIERSLGPLNLSRPPVLIQDVPHPSLRSAS
jgi:hypothetical protein